MMKRKPIEVAMLLAGLLGGGAVAIAADATNTPTATAGAAVTTTVGGTGGTVSSAGASTTASTTTVPAAATTTTLPVSSQYVDRIMARYGSLLGSTANAQSLVAGLRNGTPITLQTGSTTTVPVTTTAGAATFTSPAGRMGYGNVTRTLDLAARQLAAAGITQPTPQQLQAALTGGSVTNGAGRTTTMQGVLELRSQGMGWGKIAQTIGVHPGMGKMPANTMAGASRSGIVTADGTAAQGHSRHGEGHEALEERQEEHGSRVRHSFPSRGSIVTAGGVTVRGGERAEHSGTLRESGAIGPVATASGAGAAGGIVTANGGNSANGGGKQEGEHGRGRK